MKNQYFYIEYQSGSRKYVKTNANKCEVIMLTPFEQKIHTFNRPYPIHEEAFYNQISKVKYAAALAELEEVNIKA